MFFGQQGQHVRIPTCGKLVNWCFRGNTLRPREGPVSTRRIPVEN